jgi:hypothetical protein
MRRALRTFYLRKGEEKRPIFSSALAALAPWKMTYNFVALLP